jgi:hypothetical protein
MKYLILGAMLLLNVCASSAQTTWEEYNYLTKGYRIQRESGLDAKKGYTVTLAVHERVQERDTKFYTCIRDGETNPCAFLVVYTNSKLNQQDYICIPHHASDRKMWMSYWQKLNRYSPEALLALNWGFASAMSYFAESAAEQTKTDHDKVMAIDEN